MAKINLDDPRIAFGRVTIKVDGQEYMARTISYSDNMEFSDVEGNARMSAGTTDGVYKTDEGSLEVYAEEFAEIIEAFGEDFYGKRFEIGVAYEKQGSSKLTQDTLVKCRWTKRAANDQAGPDGLVRPMSFKPAYIKWNGKMPLKNMPAGAS